jgi:hypothetical protein
MQLNQATTDLATIFAATHCTGGCDDGTIDDDDHHDDDHHDEGIDGFNPMFEFMNRCSEANLDTDSCLVSKTMNALMGMGGPPPSNEGTNPSSTFPTSTAFDTTPMAPPSRFLQEECPGAPNISEQDFRIMMGGTRAQCVLSGVAVSDQEFDNVVNGFMTIFSSDSCFQQLCEGPNVMLMEIMFDEIAECAQVEPDMPQCLRSGLFEMMLNGGEDGRRNLLHNSSGCQAPSETEIMFQVSYFLEGAMAKCSELGEPVSQTQLNQATTDLATIFAATHCTGGCDEGTIDDDDHRDDDHRDDDCMQNNSGMNIFNIAVKYIEQCAELDLNTDTCLVSKTMNVLMAGPVSTDPHNGQSFGHRFLQTSSGEACTPPEFDETMLRTIVEVSMLQCFATAQEVEDTVSTFMSLFGAAECWEDLCAEQSTPSEALVGIMLQEIGQCAGANLGFKSCLLDQIVAFISSPDSPDDATNDSVRRKLQVVLGKSDEPADSWAEDPNDDQVRFFVSLMLAEAEEMCIELGETFVIGEIAEVESELIKLFEAQHCWGVPSDCNGNDNCSEDDDSSYLGFVKHSTTWMLGQCVDVDELSCVFSRSIDVMHSMRLLGWSHNGHPDLNNHQLDPDFSSICLPPTLIDYDIDQIAAHAQAYCTKEKNERAQDAARYNQTVLSLKNLVARNDCWEDLCHPEMKDAIDEAWMNTCASTDLKFLTNHEPIGSTTLDIDRLRCMAEFIASDLRGPNESLTCSLPRLGTGVCGLDSGRAAYTYCGGVVAPPSTSPSPPPSSSMSFSMGYNWAQYEEPDMSFTYDRPFGFSMQYDDWLADDDREPESETMIIYIGEVCSLIATMQSETSKCCLKPVCDGLWIEDALTLDLEKGHDFTSPSPSPSVALDVSTLVPTLATTILSSENASQFPSPTSNSPPTGVPTAIITSPPSIKATRVSTSPTSNSPPTGVPTAIITSPPSIKATSVSIQPTSNPVKISSLPTTYIPTQEPTNKPTPKPTNKLVELPTSSPTNMKLGEIEVSFQCEVKLEGIKVSEIYVLNLNEVVDLLVSVLRKLLPKGAIARILSVGGISVVRRLLRSLQEEGAGVDVQFEIVLKEQCDTAKCDNSAEMSKTLYQDVTSNIKAKVESGELTTSIQEAATSSGVPALAKASVNASSLQVDEATVSVKKAPEAPVNPNSAPTRVGAVGAALVLATAVATILLD